MNGGLLVDTGYFIALHDERDEHYATAKRHEHLLELHSVVLPWPILYETINTRFAKRPRVLMQIDAIVAKRSTLLLDDSPYRETAYRQVLQFSRKRPLSLVDAVLRAVIEDVNVHVSALLTFNTGDFYDVCWPLHVELPCHISTASMSKKTKLSE